MRSSLETLSILSDSSLPDTPAWSDSTPATTAMSARGKANAVSSMMVRFRAQASTAKDSQVSRSLASSADRVSTGISVSPRAT